MSVRFIPIRLCRTMVTSARKRCKRCERPRTCCRGRLALPCAVHRLRPDAEAVTVMVCMSGGGETVWWSA